MHERWGVGVEGPVWPPVVELTALEECGCWKLTGTPRDARVRRQQNGSRNSPPTFRKLAIDRNPREYVCDTVELRRGTLTAEEEGIGREQPLSTSATARAFLLRRRASRATAAGRDDGITAGITAMEQEGAAVAGKKRMYIRSHLNKKGKANTHKRCFIARREHSALVVRHYTHFESSEGQEGDKQIRNTVVASKETISNAKANTNYTIRDMKKKTR